MSEYNFVIGIREKVPYKISGPDCIVTDNDNYTITFEPDAEWDAYPAKLVYYAFDTGGAIVHSIEGNEDKIPVLTKAQPVYIGVSAGNLRTTKALGIRVQPSVRQKAGVQIKEPEPDVYDVIMEMLNNHEVRIRRVEQFGGGGGAGGGVYFTPGNALEMSEDGVLNVMTTNEAEPDNTLPITSAGVNTIVGNIGALLDTI